MGVFSRKEFVVSAVPRRYNSAGNRFSRLPVFCRNLGGENLSHYHALDYIKFMEIDSAVFGHIIFYLIGRGFKVVFDFRILALYWHIAFGNKNWHIVDFIFDRIAYYIFFDSIEDMFRL